MEDRVLKEQDLMTSIHRKDFSQALSLAFDLGHPLRLWTVLNSILEENLMASGSGHISGPGAGSGVPCDAFDRLVVAWDDERVSQCLGFIRDWNTNARHCATAQALLGSILRCVPLQRLRSMPALGQLLDGLTAYTERHFHRMDRLSEATFVLDFTIGSISTLES